MKKEKLQMTPQKNKRIPTDYYEQLYASKVDNLEEINRFVEMYHLPRLKQEEIENMNSPITSNEIHEMNQ